MGPQIPGGFYGGPGDIAARMGEARRDPGFDRIGEDSNEPKRPEQFANVRGVPNLVWRATSMA